MDYPEKFKDEKQNQSGYFDEFENILCDQETISEENQLALNNSFEQFQKKQECAKEKEILNELQRRRRKEQQEKRLLDELKNRLKQLMNEQKQWINIKKFKNAENTIVDNKEIDEMKTKIAQLISCEEKLMLQLNSIKKSDSAKVITINQQKQQKQKMKNRDKIFCSVKSGTMDNLAKSINFDFTQNHKNQHQQHNPQPKSPIENIKGKKILPKPLNLPNIKHQNKISTINQHNQEDNAKNNIKKMNNNLFSSIPLHENLVKPKPNLMLSQQYKIKQKTSFLYNKDHSPRFNQNLNQQSYGNNDHSPRIISRQQLLNNNVSGNSNHNNYQYNYEGQHNIYPGTPNHLKNHKNNNIPSNYIYQSNYLSNYNNPQTSNQNIFNNHQNNQNNDLIIPNIVFSPQVQQSITGKPLIFNAKN